MKIAVIGWPGFGAVRMRGMSLCQRFGWQFIDTCEQLADGEFWDTVIAIKRHFPTAIRNHCRRLIYDPVDCWSPSDCSLPAEYWRDRHVEFGFDDILGSSTACVQTMIDAKLPQVRIHLAKHHCDPRISCGWHDPRGHVVYAGDPVYIEPARKVIQLACASLGREFVVQSGNDAWTALRGASLCLAIRVPPHDTLLNRYCKPQIKCENAAAAGLPILSTDDPCSMSCREILVTISPEKCLDERVLGQRMWLAMQSQPEVVAVSLEDYALAIARIINNE